MDHDLRWRIYRALADTGAAPPAAGLDRDALRRLHEAHAIVLDEGGEVRMALPFSGVDTDYLVESGDRRWRANCAWDTFGIAHLLGLRQARIVDLGGRGRPPRTLRVEDGDLLERDGIVAYPLPARLWWRDIVFT
jgi:hypothetical protein